MKNTLLRRAGKTLCVIAPPALVLGKALWRAILLGLLFTPTRAHPGQLPGAPVAAGGESQAVQTNIDRNVRSRQAYVGNEACRPCHQEEFQSYQRSAHHLASRLPDGIAIEGKFTASSNILGTSNPYLHFLMSATDEGYFQSAIAQILPFQTITRRERFDLVIGSGRKGQTYLYWKDDLLFELPVSYWTETGEWMNSPGYFDGLPNFERPISARCLECHTTYLESLAPPLNRFNRTSMVLGIACEKCHGPGGAHVMLHRSGKALKPGEAEDIVNPAVLSRSRQIDLCALCHAGPGTAKTAAFSFAPGEVLANYLSIPDDPSIADDAQEAPVDVHAHQVQLLERSRCFRSSSMTCTTCHNVHDTQRDIAHFAKACLTCHKVESCGMYATMGTKIQSNCVKCHMPRQQSSQIVFDAGGHKVQVQVRSHRIAVYR
jgi:hypothetical protein